ncbi:hypothetical protein A3709_02450 [Halioglobus sp. HI00S01]|nr:hypothetical protein A3709_02450 [Halioglobus sp. HI00S01]
MPVSSPMLLLIAFSLIPKGYRAVCPSRVRKLIDAIFVTFGAGPGAIASVQVVKVMALLPIRAQERYAVILGSQLVVLMACEHCQAYCWAF